MAKAPAMPNVVGDFAWTANLAGNELQGTMHVERAAAGGYTITLESGGTALPARGLMLTGNDISLKVDAPDGVYTVKGKVADDGAIDGSVEGPQIGTFKSKRVVATHG